MDDEHWRPIVGYESTYEVSDNGKVRSNRGRNGKPIVGWRLLKQRLDMQGRPCACLSLHGKQTRFLVSHLVADAFLPPKSLTDQVVRHLNDNPADNRVVNLARGTKSDNAKDAVHNGKWRAPKGIAHSRAKLTEDQVREIRILYATGNFTQRELALQFGVDHSTIGYIVRRQMWKHI